MRVLVAGATGTVGIPLVTSLLAEGDEVTGMVRSAAGADTMHSLGAKAVHADVLDRERLLEAVHGHTYDAVIHELTALKKPPARYSDMTLTNELRTPGYDPSPRRGPRGRRDPVCHPVHRVRLRLHRPRSDADHRERTVRALQW